MDIREQWAAIGSEIDTAWTDKQFSTYFNRSRDEMDSYTRTNARITWDSNDELWQADMYGLNIDDGDDISNHFHNGGVRSFHSLLAQFLPPRTYGLKITRNFN